MTKVPVLNSDDKKTLERYSSAFTLSDMEIFIFPELFFPLVLANIMSPILWNWRNDPWFADIEKKNFIYKANRIKQYIIQNYVFNLDLSTWGLTTKTKEIDRFKDFFDMKVLRKSNALFGYEGDKYYFDIDIRKHFGLDKYNSDVIPYWKTETIEAMNAFRHKENFSTGAGECVSLSALYAAAMFVIGRIPLDKIFLIATPLHSQNYITEKEGLITNNRRIVTKNMWFNGTSLSEKARRALENEKVTIVSHISGYIHTIYETATIDKNAYHGFSSHLREFLTNRLTGNIFINFLRFKSKYKSLFQFECECSGIKRYIALDKLFEYEHTSKFSVSAETRANLIREIEGDEFHLSPIQGRIMLNAVEELFDNNKQMSIREIKDITISMNGEQTREPLQEMFMELSAFISTDPKLPDYKRNYIKTTVPEISVQDSREKIAETINNLAPISELCDLTLYVYRQLDKVSWLPYIKASIERNPVFNSDTGNINIDSAYKNILELPDQSIYDGKRLALPDEVWNFKRGDGIEKALLLANFISQKENGANITIRIVENNVNLAFKRKNYIFTSIKGYNKTIHISGNNYSVG